MSIPPMKNTLRRYADEEGGGLDPKARARVLEGVRSDGPRVVTRARHRRIAIRAGAFATAVGAALVLMTPRAPKAAACESWAELAPAAIDGRFDLGTRGRIESTMNTAAQIQTKGSCHVVVTLDEGQVTVHADDLGGGSLVVRTERGEVSVRGTVFSVRHLDGATTVEVKEGRVMWADERESIMIEAPKWMTITAPISPPIPEIATAPVAPEPIETDPIEIEADDDPAASAPTRRRRRRTRRKVIDQAITDSASPVPSPVARRERRPSGAAADRQPTDAAPEEPSVDALVRRAEALRRGRDVNGARAAYQAAGRRGGPTAEAAWIALAGYELELKRPRAALRALRERTRRYRVGALEIEGEWLAVRALAAAGERERARTKAEQVSRRWPKSPQARAAERWLEANR